MKPRKRGHPRPLAFLALCLIVLLHLRCPAPFWHHNIHFLYFVYGRPYQYLWLERIACVAQKLR